MYRRRLTYLSTGMLKNPWICDACRSIVFGLQVNRPLKRVQGGVIVLTITWLQPALSKMLATSFAVIGALLRSFLSCREYGKHGRTAVIRLAEAILHAFIAMSSSMSISLTGVDAVWIMKTSALRTDASIVTQFSPLENRVLRRAPSPTGYPILGSIRDSTRVLAYLTVT
jgi:hypothetical protein